MKSILLAISLSIIMMCNCFAQVKTTKPNSASNETLTNTSIIDLSKAGLSDDLIIAKIGTSQTNFDLSSGGLIALKNQKIGNEIIKAMMNKNSGGTPNSAEAKTFKTNAVASLPIPELINQVYRFNGATNSVTPLEKSVATMHTKSKAFGYGGTTASYEIAGSKSPVRYSKTDTVTFLINTGGSPMPDLILFKLKIDGDKRNAVSQKMSMFGGLKGADNVLAFNTVQLDNKTYKIILSQRPESGEYFFATKPTLSATTIDVFAFGID